MSESPYLNCLPTTPRITILTTILAPSAMPIDHPGKVQSPSDQLVPHSRQIRYTSSSHEDNRMFLQIMSFTRDISRDDFPIGATHTGDLSHGRVGFLGFCSEDFGTDGFYKGVALQSGSLCWGCSTGNSGAAEHLAVGHV